MAELKSQDGPISPDHSDAPGTGREEKKEKKHKNAGGRADKAFMDMLRSTNRNHYLLNQMVDRKARIVLSVDALILSLIIGKVILNHQMHDFKFAVLVVVGLACTLSIICAMLAIIPESAHGRLTDEDIRSRRGNPLFYGNFKNMSLGLYENTLMEMANDSDFIHRALIQDTYHLGRVLEFKRRYIKVSLYALTSGLCVALFLSLIARLVLP